MAACGEFHMAAVRRPRPVVSRRQPPRRSHARRGCKRGRGGGAVNPYYDDGTVTIYCADVRDLDVADIGDVACVVTSPPYNVGVGYDTHSDSLPEAEYRELAVASCKFAIPQCRESFQCACMRASSAGWARSRHASS